MVRTLLKLGIPTHRSHSIPELSEIVQDVAWTRVGHFPVKELPKRYKSFVRELKQILDIIGSFPVWPDRRNSLGKKITFWSTGVFSWIVLWVFSTVHCLVGSLGWFARFPRLPRGNP